MTVLTKADDIVVAAPAYLRRGSSRLRIGVWLACCWLLIVLLAAMLADVLPLADPETNVAPGYTPPFVAWPEFLGTDRLGRSVLSRLVHGARISLIVGLLATIFGVVLGVAAGMLAALWRSFDFFVGAVTDSLLAIPGVVLLLALAATMGPGVPQLVLGLALYALPPFARLARGTSRVVRNQPYVDAARLIGTRPMRLLAKEILPAVMRPVVAYAVVVLASLIVAEAAVSYLGLGVPPPTPTWGGMISDGESLLGHAPYLVLVPSTVLFATVLSIGVLGRWWQQREASA